MTREDVRSQLAQELPKVVGTLLGASTSKRPAAPRTEAGFGITIAGTAGASGVLRVAMGKKGAAALAKQASGAATEPTDSQTIERLKELVSKALGALAAHAPDALFSVVDAAPLATLPDDEDSLAFEVVTSGVEQGLYVVLTGDLELTVRTVLRPKSGDARTLDVIMDIELPLVVRFGRTELPLKTLTALGPGSVIDLGRAPDDPVEVLISNRVVARGEVVIVAGSYGVRVRDVVSPAERARTMEAELV